MGIVDDESHALKRKMLHNPKNNKVVKVTMSLDEYELLLEKNPYNSLAKFLREAALSIAREQKISSNQYSKLDRDFILEMSRIGTNVNQIAKALNTDIVMNKSFDSIKLLHLLAGVQSALFDIREVVR